MRLQLSSYLVPALASLIFCSLVLPAVAALPAASTTVPITAALATSIAMDFFPVTVKVSNGKLHLTQPVARFLDSERIGIAVRIQAYDHRPAQGIAISEMGRATISGKLGYDPSTQQVLLSDSRIDSLEFDQKNTATDNFTAAIQSSWSALVANPVRAPMPPHPYLLPFKNNIRDISYDGKNILLTVSY
jgi:hypothetical protein